MPIPEATVISLKEGKITLSGKTKKHRFLLQNFLNNLFLSSSLCFEGGRACFGGSWFGGGWLVYLLVLS